MTTFHLNAVILNTNETERARVCYCFCLLLSNLVVFFATVAAASTAVVVVVVVEFVYKIQSVIRDIGSMYYRILCTIEVAAVYKLRECAPARNSRTNTIRNVEIVCAMSGNAFIHMEYRNLWLIKSKPLVLCGLYNTKTDNDNNYEPQYHRAYVAIE